jgi:hypothetical protein
VVVQQLELESHAFNILDNEQEHTPSASVVVISNNSMVSSGFWGQEGEQKCSSTDECKDNLAVRRNHSSLVRGDPK